MDSAAVKGVGVFGLCGVELAADAVDERIAKDVIRGEDEEHALIANFFEDQRGQGEEAGRRKGGGIEGERR
jgi:hypothetical protein